MLQTCIPRVIGFAGWSGAGKTTLITRLMKLLTARGLSVSTIKQAHHDFDIDKPGKDSYEHRRSGAHEVLVASGNRWALMHELRGAPEPELDELLARLAPVDLVIVEGFKRTTPVKIEVHRPSLGRPLLYPNDNAIVAVASDVPVRLPAGMPNLALDDMTAIAVCVLLHAMPATSLSATAPDATSVAPRTPVAPPAKVLCVAGDFAA
jgi:molybdopterin-guanine dinucleotide biosynthesis adapter protein